MDRKEQFKATVYALKQLRGDNCILWAHNVKFSVTFVDLLTKTFAYDCKITLN